MSASNATNSIVTVSANCFDYVRVFSDGLWNVKKGETILQHSFVRFQLQLIAMFSLSHLFYIFLRRFHFPRLTSDVLAGILLGPTFFQKYFVYESDALFPPVTNLVLAALLKIGYILFSFLTGVRMDLKLIKLSGKKIIILALGLCAFPYLLSETKETKFDPAGHLTDAGKNIRLNLYDVYFDSFTVNQFIDTSALLIQLKISNSRMGHIALATTLLSDVMRYIYHNLVANTLNRLMATSSLRIGILFIIHLVLYVGFVLIVVRRLIFWFIRMTPEGKPLKDIYMHCIIALVLILASIGDGFGVDFLLGPLLVGLIIPAGSPLAVTITSKFDTIVSGLLIPLLSTFCASKIDLWIIFAHFGDAYNFKTSFIGYAIKLLVTFIFLLAIKISVKESIILAIMINAKGPREMGTFLLYTLLELEDLDSMCGVLLIFLITSYAPPLINFLYDPSKHYIGYKKKCIQYTPHDSKLQILACACKQEDALSAIKLFEISNPTKDSPLTIYGLCLQDLLGSDAPYTVNHQLGQKRSSSTRAIRSQPIIDIFKYFMLEHEKGAQVNVFTAVSPFKAIHEDICWQAFDNSCSLIVLPFHQKWNSKGVVVSNNNDIRALNNNVLDRAPCSVGILIDRSRNQGVSSIFSSSTIYRVAVLFIGGADDREAMAYALRMAKSRKVRLTIMCFITPDSDNGNSWDDMLDHESLRKMKLEMSLTNNINYIEENVKDGSDTATIVRTAQANYDLILIGRRHETQPEAVSGLSQWTEFQELGPIGDQLATSDIPNSVSILVVQQQILQASHSSILN